MGGNSWQYRYDTGWLLNEIGGAGVADWTNVHLGSDPKTNSNVTHNLNAPLSDLLVKLFYSTDGTDANSLEIGLGVYSWVAATSDFGITVYAVDNNNIKIQTCEDGIAVILDTGGWNNIDTENAYYKIKIWYLG